jgi:uncharacterized protein with PIN domain
MNNKERKKFLLNHFGNIIKNTEAMELFNQTTSKSDIQMKELIKKTNRKVVINFDFVGVCHNCNSPVIYHGEMISIGVEEKEDYWSVIPIDTYECPYCNKPIEIVKIYKALDVTNELSKV